MTGYQFWNKEIFNEGTTNHWHIYWKWLISDVPKSLPIFIQELECMVPQVLSHGDSWLCLTADSFRCCIWNNTDVLFLISFITYLDSFHFSHFQMKTILNHGKSRNWDPNEINQNNAACCPLSLYFAHCRFSIEVNIFCHDPLFPKFSNIFRGFTSLYNLIFI